MPAIVDGIAHFEEFNMNCNETEPENVVRLKQLLLESKTFKKGELFFYPPNDRGIDRNTDRIVEALEPRIFRYPENPLKWSYPIPDTNEFLDFHKDAVHVFYIERTT
ncbi:hypothetical protein CAEBREN_24729 [Caenorhabditis brenneri]|uniref:DUF38 domain-containing protein n=1 Tax=Caenorhabditis brenneri TaxID=135651 RepID=G0PJA5_CAEBE|nr:hypothetical protein CAEBREN_24729 [Caenorhabditis brenneri]